MCRVLNIAWGYDAGDSYAHVTTNISLPVPGFETHFFFTKEVIAVLDAVAVRRAVARNSGPCLGIPLHSSWRSYAGISDFAYRPKNKHTCEPILPIPPLRLRRLSSLPRGLIRHSPTQRYGNQFIAAWFVPSTGEFERWKRRGDHSMTGLPVDSGELRARQGAGSTRPPLFTSLLEPVRGRRGIEGAGRDRTGRRTRCQGHRFLLHVQTRSENTASASARRPRTARGYGSPACRSGCRPASDLLQRS